MTRNSEQRCGLVPLVRVQMRQSRVELPRRRDKHGCAVEAQFVPLVAGVFCSAAEKPYSAQSSRNNEKIDDVPFDQLNGLGVDEMIELCVGDSRIGPCGYGCHHFSQLFVPLTLPAPD